jgi:hypothetical protein
MTQDDIDELKQTIWNEYKTDKRLAAIAKIKVLELDRERIKKELEMLSKLVHEKIMAKKEWVGLTYEDMIQIWNELYKKGDDVLPTTFGRAIEARLKEKNS